MQGRLSPKPAGRPQAFPWATWRDEFARAASCGFSGIEWLVTAERFDENPLLSDAGSREIQRLVEATGVGVTSICADWCIAQPLVRVTAGERQATVERLERVVDRGAALGIEVVLVPVLENGAIRDDRDGEMVTATLAPIAAKAAQLGVRMALESELPAPQLRGLLDRGDHGLGAYYDVGNAVAAGFDPAQEIAVLGHRVFGVHIKDRHRHGSSVTLGDGDANFPPFFDALSAAGYRGPLILETPVGADPLASARRHYQVVERHLHATRAVQS